MKREENKKMYRIEKHIELVMRSTYNWWRRAIYESKCIQIKFQEHDEIADGVSLWVPILAKPSIIMKDISSCFYRVYQCLGEWSWGDSTTTCLALE